MKGWLCRSDVYASKSDQLLSCGAMIVAELRTAVLEETGFTTSAGIAHNKVSLVLLHSFHLSIILPYLDCLKFCLWEGTGAAFDWTSVLGI